MDQPPEVGVSFGDLKKEERYKKLERNLKLAFVKQMEQAKVYIDKGYCTSPTWPSLSTINVDNLDTTGNPSLQVSRVESEVVSSSSNLHKMLTMKRTCGMPMATSSVKKFPINDYDRDRAIMPPPAPINLMYRNPKIVNEANARHSAQNQYGTNSDLENQVYDPSNISKKSVYQEYSDSGLSKPSTPESRESRIFRRWRVLLNDQGQLIVKGFLADCGKVARSKPILQRFSSDRIQSVFKHIYILDGNIVDERNELPEYVRGKFHNGFPDDWENVYQLWRNYVSKGCKVTFRWPTPITDSDDDLVTEITDFTYSKNKQANCSESMRHSNFIPNNATSSGYHSKSQSYSHQSLEKSNEENVGKPSETVNKKNCDSGHIVETKESIDSREHENSNNTKDSLNFSNNCTNIKYSRYLHEILQEDKLRVIRSNLGDKNCPPEYLDKFIELIDCLRYLLSFVPHNETDAKNQPQSCSKCSSTISFSESQEINQEQSNNVIVRSEDKHKEADYSKNLELNENCISKPADHDKDVIMTDSSDSDAFMGIPNVPKNRIFNTKMRSERYRDVKNRIKEKKSIEKNKQNKKLNQSQDQRLLCQNDSSVIMTEDNYESRQPRNVSEQSNTQFAPPKPTFTRKNLDIKNAKYDEAQKITVPTDVETISEANINSRSTPRKRIIEKPKPIIKSNEQVNIDLKSRGFLRKPLPTHSDVSILDDEITAKKPKLAHVDKNVECDEKLTDDLMQHPFLTYDSEDLPDFDDESVENQPATSKTKNNLEKKNLENEEKNPTEKRNVLQESPRNQNKVNKKDQEQKLTLSSKRKKMPTNDKAIKSKPFGSKENPKLLMSWIPCVMYEDELKKKYSLIFEGKLLNEAGHVLNRKFVSDSILKRYSPTLIETVKNEYFMLVGEVSDTKHALPKELLKQCRTGCPAKIKEFCEEWKRLKPVLEKPSKIEILHNTSIKNLSVPTSSRGRKILPPLNYWRGERVVTKEFETIYEAGDILETSLKIEPSKKSLASNEKMQDKKETNVKSNNRKSYVKPLKAEIKSSNSSSAKISKKRIAQQTKNSENDSSDLDNKESSTNKNPVFSVTRSRKNEEIFPESTYNTKLRKRQRIEVKQSVPQNLETKSRQRKTLSNIKWSYEKKQDLFDVLSDDQSSVVIK